MSGSGGCLSRMSGSGQEALPDVRERLGGSGGCPGMVENVTQMSGSGQDALLEVQVWSDEPPECPGVVRRP